MTFVCLDFETANYARSSACQLGAVIVLNGEVTRTASWMIKPEPFAFEPLAARRNSPGGRLLRRARG